MNLTEAEIQKRRLRWKCRRGMLELDLFLIPYLEKHYDELNSAEKEIFARLLDEEDTQLYAWLLKIERPADPVYASLIDSIINA